MLLVCYDLSKTCTSLLLCFFCSSRCKEFYPNHDSWTSICLWMLPLKKITLMSSCTGKCVIEDLCWARPSCSPPAPPGWWSATCGGASSWRTYSCHAWTLAVVQREAQAADLQNTHWFCSWKENQTQWVHLSCNVHQSAIMMKPQMQNMMISSTNIEFGLYPF